MKWRTWKVRRRQVRDVEGHHDVGLSSLIDHGLTNLFKGLWVRLWRLRWWCGSFAEGENVEDALCNDREA